MQAKFLLVAALVGAQFAAATAFAKEPFTAIYFSPTDGRVGYRFGSGLVINVDDVPSGNTGRPIAGSCQVHFVDHSHVGTLPPGIERDATKAGVDIIAGTPRQPGRWSIIVYVSIWCSGGPDLTRYERQVPVTFNIEP